jgi:hypothetical protein
MRTPAKNKAPKNGASVRRVELEAARVLTVDETLGGEQPASFAGNYVRLKPSDAVTREGVKALETSLRDSGAAVKVELPVSATLPITGNPGVTETHEPEVRQSPREFVLGLVETSQSANKRELAALIERLADGAGL